ncbi:MAG: hypothetical protein AB1631_14550 [Acidobacteriota bacterium]
MERTTRRSEITVKDFIDFYPYLPHFVELSIDVMSGIRLQPGAPKHLGGSNRTIIKQAYEMLVSDRTAMARQTVGALVTLDKIFELVEGNLSTEKQKDISDITQRFKDDVEDRGMAIRVAKTICLLEFVRDLPRTEANIAACLVDKVGDPSPLAQVKSAIERLREAKFVRNTEEGWKLQTAQEKNWETERRSYLAPSPRERNDILREAMREIFSEPGLKTLHFRGLRNFRVGVTLDGARVSDEGQVPLALSTAEDMKEFPAKLIAVTNESRDPAHKHDIYWVYALTDDIDSLIANLYASRRMVARYDQMRVQNRINNEEMSCLTSEKHEVIRFQNRLREKLIEGLEKGQGVFRGVVKDAASLGRNLSEIIKNLFDYAVPDLYPKLQMGAYVLKGTEAEELLKAANLSGLSQVFYGGEQGLNLVIRDGSRTVANPAADVAKEVLDYLKREHSYGNKITGKILEDHFQGIGYGWERDLLRLILAVLLRAGTIEVTYQGRRYINHQDPQCRAPFINNTAFKSASFAPRESIDLKTLTTAVQNYENMTGEEVDVEEGAIAAAFKKLADGELKILLPVEAVAMAHRLPVRETLDSYHQTLVNIASAASDDCVIFLAREGKSFKDTRDRVRRIRDAIGDATLDVVRQARATVDSIWPVLEKRGQSGELTESFAQLQTLIAGEDFFEHTAEMKSLSLAISNAYQSIYRNLHDQRCEAFSKAIEEIKGRPEWVQAFPTHTASASDTDKSHTEQVDAMADMQSAILAPLASRACAEAALFNGGLACQLCEATLNQMESDLAALGGLRNGVLSRLQELSAPVDAADGARIERIRVADFFTGILDSEASIDENLDRLREHLHKLIAEGAKVIIE